MGLARARLRDAPRRIADEEDVALSAFDSFCRGAQAGRFPRLDDRNDLWQILALITVRKAIDLRNYEGRPSRTAGRVRSLTELTREGLEAIGGDEPTPELAAQLAEEYQRLMEQLGDSTLQSVATWKLRGVHRRRDRGPARLRHQDGRAQACPDPRQVGEGDEGLNAGPLLRAWILRLRQAGREAWTRLQ